MGAMVSTRKNVLPAVLVNASTTWSIKRSLVSSAIRTSTSTTGRPRACDRWCACPSISYAKSTGCSLYGGGRSEPHPIAKMVAVAMTMVMIVLIGA